MSDFDVLGLQDRVQTAIELGESHFREFKSAYEGPPEKRTKRDPRLIARDIGEALVAFANADGGELLVGVEDSGIITGVPHGEDTLAKLLQASRNNVYPETPIEPRVSRRLQMSGHTVLYFSVAKSTSTIHLTSDGRCLQRRDKETVPVTFEKLQVERQEQISREYDRQFVDGATMLDLDIDLVKRVADNLTAGMSAEKCLQYLDLAEFAFETPR